MTFQRFCCVCVWCFPPVNRAAIFHKHCDVTSHSAKISFVRHTHRSIDRTHAISTCAISLTAHFITSPPSSRGKLRYDHWNDVIISCNALVICVGIGIWSDNVVGYLYSWNLKIRAHALILFAYILNIFSDSVAVHSKRHLSVCMRMRGAQIMHMIVHAFPMYSTCTGNSIMLSFD